MRVLLTNHTLGARAGTEVYVRDVALALLARGHEPMAYSRHLGEVARALRRATVPVLDDLDDLDPPPDLIHAQHHLEAMTALARFPGTPAVYVCHGWLPDEEAPPRHPRILRYVAVDELVRRRLREECGLDEARVRLHLNFVDLNRFPARPPLAQRPQRAAVFSNYVSDDNCLPVVRRACARAGLSLDVIGRAQGRASSHPERLLGRYDVVFAKGRAALEASAVGAAVILCDVAGLGPMVNSRDFDHQRALNFGVRLLSDPVTIDGVSERIERYDSADAAEVNRRIRCEAGMEGGIDRLLDLYGEVISESRRRSVRPEGEARALAAYLRRGPLTGGDFHRPERERLLAEVAGERARVAELRQALADSRAVSARLAAENAELNRAVGAMHAEKVGIADALEAERHRLQTEQRLADQLEQIEASRVELWRRLGEVGSELTEVAAERHREWQARGEAEAARHDAEAARHDAEAARREAEAQLEALGRRAAQHAEELRWIRGSFTWRLRRALLAVPGMTAIYRAIGSRRSRASSSTPTAPSSAGRATQRTP